MSTSNDAPEPPASVRKDADFRTFCHLNDYLEEGYGALHHMVAASSPLVLWAPSGGLLEHYRQAGESRIGIYGLVRLVEEGHVRIIGRREWILDSASRKNHSWPGAAWQPRYDPQIRRIALEDERQNVPPRQRRVLLVEKEKGREWAESLVNTSGNRNQVVRRINDLLEQRKVPVGSLQKAMRIISEGKPREKALAEILRDARNHRDAIDDANAKLPFLSDHDGEFFRLLPESATTAHSAETASLESNVEELLRMSDFAQWTKDLIKDIEDLGPKRRLRSSNIRTFLKSNGHRELILWLNEASELLATKPLPELDKILRHQLADRIDLSVHERGWWEFTGSPMQPFLAVAWLISTGISLVAMATTPIDLLTVGSLVFGTAATPSYLAYHQILMKSPDYNGPQWPFAIAHGRQHPSITDISGLTSSLRRQARQTVPKAEQEHERRSRDETNPG